MVMVLNRLGETVDIEEYVFELGVSVMYEALVKSSSIT